MKRKVLIPTNPKEVKEQSNQLIQLQRLGITIDEVRTLLSEWVSRNLGMHDMASKVKYCIEYEIPVAHQSGYDLAIFRREIKLENSLPEDFL